MVWRMTVVAGAMTALVGFTTGTFAQEPIAPPPTTPAPAPGPTDPTMSAPGEKTTKDKKELKSKKRKRHRKNRADRP